ncbi:5217_t:CDS:1 [Funneliformis caledonium]|uniref:5217_t:CDS:1 n=1 Tax=Funneliformis caledonium TaxID=1117310 RepID=A0A9N9A0F5_9GLOM|nr:5217_t:CDS:1 [Funneliformis caledonium]
MGLFNTIFGDIKLTDVLIGLLTITCSYVFYFYYKYFTRLNPLPGPIPLPLIGSFAIFMEDIDAWFFRLNKIYGRDGIFELNIAGNRQIIMTRTDYVDKFMTSSTSSHIMRTANNGLLDLFDLHNKGVGLNHSYQHWKFNRQIFSQAVMPLSLTNKPSNILNQLFEEMAGLWIDLKPENDYGTTIDMAAWLRRFTADFISLLTTGKHISVMNHYRGKLKRDVMTEEMIESEEFIDCINTFVSDNQIIFVPKILKDLPLIKPRVNKLLDNCDRFYNKLVNIIRNRRKEIEKEIKIGLFKTEQMDLLTSLIIANTQYDPNPQKNLDPTMNKLMTDDEIRGVMFDAFVAGTDTVSDPTLSFDFNR